MMIALHQGYAQETQAVQATLERVHDEVFGGFWLRRLLPIPALLRTADYAGHALSLRSLEERLRLIRLACLGAPLAEWDADAALEVGTFADTLQAATTALRRILERLQRRAEGDRYEMDEFAADVERYNALIETHRTLRLSM